MSVGPLLTLVIKAWWVFFHFVWYHSPFKWLVKNLGFKIINLEFLERILSLLGNKIMFKKNHIEKI